MRKDDDEPDIVKDGEGIRQPFLLRDSARRVTSPSALAGRNLRCTDTGRRTFIDAAFAAGIESEAAREGLTVMAYLARIRFELEQ